MSALAIPNSFVPSTLILAAATNANFAAIVSWSAGGIGNDNFDTLDGPIEWSISTNVRAIDITSSAVGGAVYGATSAVISSNEAFVKFTTSVAQTSAQGLVAFISTHTSSTTPTLYVSGAGSGAAVDVAGSGSGSAIKGAASSTGKALHLTKTGAGVAAQIDRTGSGGAGLYINDTGTTNTTDGSAFTVDSTVNGAKLPRLTTAQRKAISNPSEGLEIYNTTLKRKEIYNGTYWVSVAGDTGRIIDWPGAGTLPAYLVECYGQTLSDDSNNTYAAAIAVLSTTYGSSGTVPDLRGRVIAGKDNMGGSAASRLTSTTMTADGVTMGAVGGAQTHTLTTSELASHSHSGASSSHTHASGNITARIDNTGTEVYLDTQSGATGWTANDKLTASGSAGSGTRTKAVRTQGTSDTPSDSSTGSAGSGSAHNNVQPTIILRKCLVL